LAGALAVGELQTVDSLPEIVVDHLAKPGDDSTVNSVGASEINNVQVENGLTDSHPNTAHLSSPSNEYHYVLHKLYRLPRPPTGVSKFRVLYRFFPVRVQGVVKYFRTEFFFRFTHFNPLFVDTVQAPIWRREMKISLRHRHHFTSCKPQGKRKVLLADPDLVFLLV